MLFAYRSYLQAVLTIGLIIRAVVADSEWHGSVKAAIACPKGSVALSSYLSARLLASVTKASRLWVALLGSMEL